MLDIFSFFTGIPAPNIPVATSTDSSEDPRPCGSIPIHAYREQVAENVAAGVPIGV